MAYLTNALKHIARYIVFGDFYIALIAVCFTLETYFQLNSIHPTLPLLLGVFFATLFTYNIHRILAVIHYGESSTIQTLRHEWVKQNFRLFTAFTLFALVGLLICLLYENSTTILLLIPAGILTLGYSLPFIRINGRLFRFRDIPGLKIFIVSFVWAAATVLLPAADMGIVKWDALLLLLAMRMLFVFSITIPFDVRDMEKDKASGILTIPQMLGEKRSKKLGLWLLFGFLILAYLFDEKEGTLYFIPMVLSAIYTGFLIYKSSPKKNEYYYLFWMDGTMAVQFLLVYGWNLIRC